MNLKKQAYINDSSVCKKKKYKSLPNDFKHKSDMESVSDAYLDDIILKIDRG